MLVCSCTRSARETKVALVEPTSRIRSGLSASTLSRLAVLPRPVIRPRPGAYVGQHVSALFRPIGTWPTEQQVWRERVEKNRSRRTGGEYAHDFLRHRQRAPRRVG